MARTIYLVGFMCCGKTRIGRELASRLHRPFVDVDRAIEERVGAITPFFLREGEAAFRQVEHDVLLELLKEDDRVVACGGGTPLEQGHMPAMKANGTTVFLHLPLKELQYRVIRKGKDRPMFFGLADAAIEEKVAALLSIRSPIYEQAHFTVDAQAEPVVVVDRILAVLEAGQLK